MADQQTYTGTGGDGKKYRIPGPAGLSQEQVDAELKKQFPAAQTPKDSRSLFQRTYEDIPKEVAHDFQEGWETVRSFGPRKTQPGEGAAAMPWAKDMGLPDWALDGVHAAGKRLMDTFQAAGGAMEMVGSPVSGAAKSIFGHAAEEDKIADYETAKKYVDPALAAASLGRLGVSGLAKRGARRFLEKTPKDLVDPEFGTTAPRGPVPEKLPPAGEEHVKKFEQQTGEQRTRAEHAITESLDPSGRPLAQLPTRQDLGVVTRQGLDQADRARKAATNTQYSKARSIKGEFDGGGFENLDKRFYDELTDPNLPTNKRYVLTKELTPGAWGALQQITKSLETLQLNAAGRAVPGSNRKPGLSLHDIDVLRQEITSWGSIAKNNAQDYRTYVALVTKFDDYIKRLVSMPGMFKGDQNALGAWELARAMDHEYKGAFRGERGTVGAVVNKIVRGEKGVQSVPNDIAKWMLGSPGSNPTSMNVGVMKGVRDLLGVNSDAWVNAKQVTFGELVKDAKTGENIRNYLRENKQMADVLFSPKEQKFISNYADVLDTLGIERIPQQTSGIQNALKTADSVIRHRFAYVVTGAATGMFSALTHLHPGGMAAGGAAMGALYGYGKLRAAQEMRKLERALPIVNDAIKKYDRAVRKAESGKVIDRAAAYTATYEATKVIRQQLGVDMGPMQPPDDKRGPRDKLGLPRPQMGGPQQ